jgi:uncharacterized membrane-anchored protein YitT (DUF2179 family)
MGRGVTLYNGRKGYGKGAEMEVIEIIYTVITRLEVNKLNTELKKIEPDAFVIMNQVKDVKEG